MKTLTPTNLIAVEVPKEGREFEILNLSKDRTALHFIINKYGGYLGCFKDVTNLDFEIIGEVTDTETNIFNGGFLECEESIDIPEYKYGGELHPKEMFWDYEEKSFSLESSENSFRSLLQSNGLYFENPLGKEPNQNDECYREELEFMKNNPEVTHYGDHYADWCMWQESENKLIKGKLIILKQK